VHDVESLVVQVNGSNCTAGALCRVHQQHRSERRRNPPRGRAKRRAEARRAHPRGPLQRLDVRSRVAVRCRHVSLTALRIAQNFALACPEVVGAFCADRRRSRASEPTRAPSSCGAERMSTEDQPRRSEG
jgi:hypothetical protein